MSDDARTEVEAAARPTYGLTAEDTWKRVGRLLDTSSPNECANFIKNAGYVPI